MLVDTDANFTDITNHLVYESLPHAKGDKSVYNSMGQLTWPIIYTWGPYNDSALNSDLDDDHVSIGCLRAETAEEGSSLPSNSSPRGVVLGSSTMVLSALLAAVASFAL